MVTFTLIIPPNFNIYLPYMDPVGNITSIHFNKLLYKATSISFMVIQLYNILIYITQIYSIWANYNISPTWIKAIWGSFPLLIMIPVRENSELVII